MAMDGPHPTHGREVPAAERAARARIENARRTFIESDARQTVEQGFLRVQTYRRELEAIRGDVPPAVRQQILRQFDRLEQGYREMNVEVLRIERGGAPRMRRFERAKRRVRNAVDHLGAIESSLSG